MHLIRVKESDHLDESLDEEGGDDGEDHAGHQLQEEAVEPDVEGLQGRVLNLEWRKSYGIKSL